MTGPTPLIGYVRVSTDRQELSPDAQRRALEHYAALRGWDGLEVVVDHGAGGGTLDRPGVREVLDRLTAGGALVVAKVDRLSRSTEDVLALLRRSRAEGWQLVAIDLGVDTSTPLGRFLATIVAAFGELELDLIRQRTTEALAEKRAQGQRLGRPSAIPGDVVERIRAERAAGASYEAIAGGLNRDGVPTVRGGAQWRRGTVRGALKTAELDDEASARR